MKIKVDNLAATVEKTLSDYADDVKVCQGLAVHSSEGIGGRCRGGGS